MSDAPTTHLPLITVLMPVRNERGPIEASLRSVLENGYPAALIDLVVLDGLSDDGTRELLAELAPCLGFRVLDNPSRTVPAALNLGITAARGSILFRLDGHAFFLPGYLRRVVDLLENRPDLHGAGAALISTGAGPVGRAIARAQSSPFGVGDSRFRIASYEGLVDSLAFAGYRAEVFQRIGGFDEELVRNQDDEFNYRLRGAGLRLWMLPEPGSIYQVRGSWRHLWRQYRQYGFWKIRVMQKRGEVPSLRSAVPLIFVAAWLGAAALLPVSSWPLGLLASVYGLFLAAAAGHGQAADFGERIRKALAVAILHSSYGFGEWVGILRFILGWKWIGEWASLSRGPQANPAWATGGAAS